MVMLGLQIIFKADWLMSKILQCWKWHRNSQTKTLYFDSILMYYFSHPPSPNLLKDFSIHRRWKVRLMKIPKNPKMKLCTCFSLENTLCSPKKIATFLDIRKPKRKVMSFFRFNASYTLYKCNCISRSLDKGLV